jgi:Mitochondrial ribosomal death-associated protein 3
LETMKADKATLGQFFTEAQLERIDGYSGDTISLIDLLSYGIQRKMYAPMCYAVVMDRLMNQDEKPFLIVLDEANCYFDNGHYYHMAYDEDVKQAIPYDQISLFEPALNAMAMTSSDDEELNRAPKLMKRGGIVFGVTESRAVRRKVTDGLTAYAQRQSTKRETPPRERLYVVEVERFSDLEADHILANFEATGVGKLRLDRGDTIMDTNEVAYLKSISGNIGQKLLDVSII